MNSFEYQYPVRQHFGKGCAESTIKEEMKNVGKRVMLAYGGSSLKRTGLYDKVCAWLTECGKDIVDFGGIMPNPTYVKVQEGAKIARENHIDFILPMGAVVTASGTGAEQNCGAVITHEEKKLQQPLFGAFHSFAVLDSDLTKTLPMKQVVSGAFDTLSHCMETYMGKPQAINISDEAVLRAAADTCFLTPGCCKQFSRDEIFEILKEVM